MARTGHNTNQGKTLGQLLTGSHAQSPRKKEEPGALADIRKYRDSSGWEATEVHRGL